MKIAMIGQKGVPGLSGGIERHVEELSAVLSDQGHDVLVYCRSWYSGVIAYHRGIRCVYSPGIRSKHLDAITHTFTAIIKATRERVDVFHIHGVGPALLAWLPKLLRPSAKVIVTFHCIDRHHQKWNIIGRLALHVGELAALRFADATITVSQALQAYCRLSYGADTMYIPNGTQIPMRGADMNELSPFNLEPNRYLLMCARLVRHKGAHTLVNAWKQARAADPALANMKLAIVGGGAFTDAYVKELQQMAANDSSIVLTGAQTGETLHALFAHCYATVHPSESEGLPIAILEAMSYGKCVLSSDIPENLELTRDHGLTFHTNNVNELATQIRMLVAHPDLVQAVGADARIFVARRYDWNDIADLTVALYEIVIREPELKTA